MTARRSITRQPFETRVYQYFFGKKHERIRLDVTTECQRLITNYHKLLHINYNCCLIWTVMLSEILDTLVCRKLQEVVLYDLTVI